ncbi:MAG: T9SS type A sorting domain-containing protein [Salinivirgaceae bacterium]|nr:T9SS type A sorting domain-containing protein [Salinivirgaceae bacterium]
MRKSLLILAALIAFGGISAQAQGPKNKLDKERKEKKEWKANLPQNPFVVKQSAAKDGPIPMMGDHILNVTPAIPLQFTFNKCDEVKSRPLVIKNPSDETINAFLTFGSKAGIELGDTVFDDYSNYNNCYILNYFEVNGFGYAANGDEPYLIKTDLATGNQIEKYNNDEGYRGLAYDGKLFWTSSGNYLIALDANLNPTGKQIYVGYRAFVAFDGTNLIAAEIYTTPTRVKAFDTNGNLVADYGTFPMEGFGLAYEPATGLFWMSTEGASIGFNLADGKVNIAAVCNYPTLITGFDADGLPFVTDYNSNLYILRKATKFNTQPKGISLSQQNISLKPGETVTVNVTASVEHGAQDEMLGCMDLDKLYSSMPYFMRVIEFALNIEPEFVTTGAQLSAFAGYNAQPQTVWLKNTGCVPIVFDEQPTLEGEDYFSIRGLIEPENFEGELLVGDSIGAVIGFYSDDAGEYTGKLIITTENTEPIEISLSATATELDYTIPEDPVTATINCGANTVTASCNIANNSGVTMTIGESTASVNFEIHIGGWGSEVYWQLLNSAGIAVYSVNSSTYSSNTNYNLTLELPADTYTLDMHDSYGDGWNGGYITVKWDGKTLLKEATVPRGSHNTKRFAIEGLPAPVVIANGATVSQITLPLDMLEIGDITALPVFFEGIANAVASISVETPDGESELVVGDAIDYGESIVDNSAFQLFAIAANNGCGKLNLSSVSIDNESDFMFLYGDYDFVKSISNIEVEPKDTLKLYVVFNPSQTGVRTGTITITPAEGTPATIQLTGTGINEPGYPVLAYEGEGLGFVLDTVGCSQTSFTLQGRIANNGEADLVVTEPITITYQAGKVNEGSFEIYTADGNYIDDWRYSPFNFTQYIQLEEGDYQLMVYNYAASDGKIIIKSGSKTLLTANVADADANCNPYFNFTITAADLAKHTVEPGDTLDLAMTICPRNNNSGLNTFNYPISTNDPDDDYVELSASVRIVKEPKLVFTEEVIDFGEVTVGQWAEKKLDWEDTGCGDYDPVFMGVLLENGEPNNNSPFGFDGSVYFEPISAGTFEDKLSVVISYYYDGTKQVKDTFNVTVKGVGVASPSIVLPEELTVVTAEKGATMVTATVPVGNSSTTTALKLTDAKLAFITLNSGIGTYYSNSSWTLYRITEHNEETVISKSGGYFTAAGQQKIEEVMLPAGDYRLYMYNGSTSNWNGGFVSIKTSDGIELLGETRNTTGYSNEFNTYFSIAERNTDVTVAPATETANGTVNVVFEIPVKGLEVGEYYFGRVYNTNDASNSEIELMVKVVIEDDFDYEYSKEEVEFTQVHIGAKAYSSVTLRNLGTVGFNINAVSLKDGSIFNYEYSYDYVAVGDSLKFNLLFDSEYAGTFRDTLYVGIYNSLEDEIVTDTIPLVAFATNTQVIAVSSPNRYAAAGDVVNINVTFDNQVIISGESDAMPQLKMNNDAFAVLDSTAFDTDRDDTYTFTFKYTVQSNDNIALFDYKEDTVYMKGKTVVDIDDASFSTIKLPAVGTLASTFPITLDNKAPQLAGFDYALDGLALELTVSFNEEVVGLNKNSFTLTGAEITEFKTKDNKTFTAAVTAQPCTDIVITINVNLKDLAGNAKKINETINVPAIHNYTASVVAPTCTEAGYTLNVCSLCKHEEHTNEVAATGHTAGKPVKENETAEGYDEVVYCTVCGAEIDRKHVSTTAIADNAVNALIYTNDGAIVVETAEANGAEISVVDINGRLVAKAKATSTRTVIPMSVAGVYVVSVGETTEKVALQ